LTAYLRLGAGGSGIPTHVVVPSVSLANVLHGTALTVFVETPSSAILSRPVCVPGNSGLPGCGVATARGGAPMPIAGGGAMSPAGGELFPTVPGIWASAMNGIKVREVATNNVIFRIEASLRMQQ
jgi:hypothetical protein